MGLKPQPLSGTPDELAALIGKNKRKYEKTNLCYLGLLLFESYSPGLWRYSPNRFVPVLTSCARGRFYGHFTWFLLCHQWKSAQPHYHSGPRPDLYFRRKHRLDSPL